MSNKILQIGITGGIGSGKSFLCKIFESLSYKIYYADAQAKSLMSTEPFLVKEIKTLLGEEAYLPAGNLNRGFVSEVVFKNPEKLKALNALVHPAVGRDFQRWYKNLSKGYTQNFVLKEAAILYESGAYRVSDGVISVYAPKNLRIKRILERDPTNRKAILARMDQQWSESEKVSRADFTIFNDGKHHLLPQVRDAIRFFSGRL
jgi:dephospho-CoA kinase